MPVIGSLVTFSPNTYIKSSDMNANFSAIVSAFNTSAVLTDLAKTITVAHIFSQGANFSGGTVNFSGATVTNLTAAGTFTGNLTGNVTGNVTGNTSGTAATVTGATQASITTLANVTTVGALNTGSITSGFGSIDIGSDAISGGVITGTELHCSALFTDSGDGWSLKNHTGAITYLQCSTTGALTVASRIGSGGLVSITGDVAGHLFLNSISDPASPVNGAIWFTGTALKIRIGGVTKTFTVT